LNFRALPWSRFHAFDLSPRGDSYILVHVDGQSKKDIGILDLITTGYLRSLQSFSDVVYVAIISLSDLNGIRGRSIAKKTVVDISVNILGPVGLVDEVGDTLEVASAFLQHPVFLEAGVEYLNPQYFYPNNNRVDLREFIGPARQDYKALCISQGIEDALFSLDGLPGMLGNRKYLQPLCMAVDQRSLIRTSLKGFVILLK
jgi:SWI/SNF-related matrix-associated actin-dependent regulator of chromatin subfamily A3